MATNDLETEELLTDLFKCVSAEALRRDNIEKYDIRIYGTEDKIEQYGSDIAFVDITVENFNGEKRKYNLVLKYGHTQKNIKNKVPIREGFKREIEVYSKLIPCYQKFLTEKVLPPLDSIPKCFLTKFSETDEIIVLENLKRVGYHTYDRKRPMSQDHIKLVLERYAEWHALSFALETQEDSVFLEVKEFMRHNPWKTYFENQLGEMIDIGLSSLYRILEEHKEFDLLLDYKKKIGSGNARCVLNKLLNIDEHVAVILHGDCWNNNFLFQYENNDSKRKDVNKAAILDFQLSSYHSPIFDLSHFIYSVASTEELRHLKTLIDHYYQHLCDHLNKMSCDPEIVFPLVSLKKHWKKYAAYGAVLSPYIAMYCYIKKENTADFGVIQTLRNATLKKDYQKRVMAVAKHFVQFEWV